MKNTCSIILPDGPTEIFNAMIQDEIMLLNKDYLLDTMNEIIQDITERCIQRKVLLAPIETVCKLNNLSKVLYM